MSKKKKLIPELRFPEFKNEGEWEIKALEDALDYERPDKYIVSDTNYQNEGTPVLTANKSFILGYTNEDFGIYKKLPAIIFDDFTVDSKFVDFPFKVKSSAIKILTPKKKDDLRFAYELISQIDFNAAQHKRYYISEYQKLKLPFPSLKEQEKIASCLSSLDDLISAHSQKLDLLKDHKKGLMQNLFPQEGEKVPKLRFKEFEKDGEWVKKTIEGFAPLQRGFDLPVDDIIVGDYPVVFSNGILKYHKEYKVKAPGIVTGRSGTIGKVTYVEKDFWPHNTSLWVTDFCGNYPLFVYHYFVRIGLEKFRAGGGVPTLNRNDVHRSKIFIPISKKEQQKIASCLSSIDELITEQAEKIEQLKLHKKGLMQGLFPKMND